MVSVCIICAVRTVKVDNFLWNSPAYSERCAIFLEDLKKTLGKNLSALKAERLRGNHVLFWGRSFGGVVMRGCCT